jgi:hypothetical protein
MKRIKPVHAHTSLRLGVMMTAAALLTVLAASGSGAQTLTDPTPTKPQPPATVGKPTQAGHVKSCSTYGAGFVNVPGTDTCVKIGGYLREEGAMDRSR